MLDIYTSISNQFKPEGDIVDNTIVSFFRKAGYEVKLRRFSGGNYPSKDEVVGNPDVLVVHVGTDPDERIGKGSVEELEYAVWEDIPAFAANKNGLFIPRDVVDIRSDDWRMHAKVLRTPIEPYQLKTCMKAVNPKIMIEAIDSTSSKDISGNQKGSDRLLL